MLKLRTILLYDFIYYFLLLITLLSVIIRVQIPKESKYSEDSRNFSGIVTKYVISSNSLKITLSNEEVIIGNYYFKTEKEVEDFKNKINLGDKIIITGEFQKPPKNTTKNLFNYRKYLYNKNIHYIVSIDSYKKLEVNNNLYYFIKQKVIERLSEDCYLYTFILGEKAYLSKDATASFQENGISHLFAISGMHITLLSSIFLKLFGKIFKKEKVSYFLTGIGLIFYLFLTGLAPSILRGVLFFILFSINKIYYLYIKPVNLFIVVFWITLSINPFYIFDVGFLYSFLISFTLIVMADWINIKNSYFVRSLKTSFLSFLVSIPISLYYFYQINFMSIIYNLFYVPFVSVIIFPLSLLTFVFPFLLPVYNFFTSVLEGTSLFFSKISFGKMIFPKLFGGFYILYFLVLIFMFIRFRKGIKKTIILLFFLLMVHYMYPIYRPKTYLKMIDVGQGDSILLHSKGESVLIDTGGLTSYYRSLDSNNQGTIVRMKTIPLLKSLGIKKLKYLVLTHGDYDHMGEAKNIIDDFKVEKIYLNQGNFNDLEKEVIKKYKNIYQVKEGQIFKIGNITLLELNKDFEDENDSSSIFLMYYKDLKILFTGDASVESEKYILQTYNLPEVDILKVGHHGSITSTSEELLQVTNPKLALISCGVDNKFGHPHKEIIEKLENYNVNYLTTALDGTITIDLDNGQVIEEGKTF